MSSFLEKPILVKAFNITEMRRIVLFLSLLLLSAPAFAQEIRYTKLTNDSWEFMTTDESYIVKGRSRFDVAFQVYNDIKKPNPDNQLRYFLILTFHTHNSDLRIPLRGKLLIKTGKDEVVTSLNDVTLNGIIPTYSPTTGEQTAISCHKYMFSYYNNCGRYELTLEDIKKIVMESIDMNLPLEEKVKVGKTKKTLNWFGASFSAMMALSDTIFNPLKSF